ncbi:MAG: S-methyl-5-thioribose-1-phosphate isomerase [Desulfobulbaceae bacterium]|nr:S-methyl-5-thioribose-1-phosphate isomerase [Desulfobulbaceae bacterium]
MRVGDRNYRSIWLNEDGRSVDIIDQTRLPHEFIIVSLQTLDDAAHAIREMLVRGAPLIGATAAYGVCFGLQNGTADHDIDRIGSELTACRPTAVNLRWAVERMSSLLRELPENRRVDTAYEEAARICEEDVRVNEAIGTHGLEIIRQVQAGKNTNEPVRILTHCNAGWLATVDWGTALAPVYKAHEAGIPVHIWVDETRPRSQGASLTAWELAAQGIDHSLIVDNAGGHLMQHGMVDLCIVGSDRTTSTGDVCNKIGTYLKALAARDNNVPFYVALPGSTVDWLIADGLREIPIEERSEDEVLWITGKTRSGSIESVRIAPLETPADNPAFDVTPAPLITGLITERGVCSASREGLLTLFPERVQESERALQR